MIASGAMLIVWLLASVSCKTDASNMGSHVDLDPHAMVLRQTCHCCNIQHHNVHRLTLVVSTHSPVVLSCTYRKRYKKAPSFFSMHLGVNAEVLKKDVDCHHIILEDWDK